MSRQGQTFLEGNKVVKWEKLEKVEGGKGNIRTSK